MIKKIFLPIFVVLFISSCAVITAPTGGDRDEIAPKVVGEVPPNNSTNFSSKTIEIHFDEYVQVQNAQNIVISPAIDPFPEISARKKTLTIKFKKPLEPKTTYSIFFGSNVSDVNESNKLDNYSYVFSTGDYLDSLTVKGHIQTPDGNIPDNSYLLLYKEQDDSSFQKKRPFYLSKIEKDGSVQLEHVKAGTYKLYTLSDKNLNYYYDLPTELIGFADSAFTINGNFDSLQMPLFLPEESNLRIVEFDKTITGGIFNITLNKELSFTKDELTVRVSEDNTLETAAFPDTDNKHVKIYFTNLDKDSAYYTLLVKNNNKLIDSVRVKSESKNFKTTAVYFADTNALKNITVLETQPLKLQSVYYSLSPIDTGKIELTDSSKNKIPVTVEHDANLRTYIIRGDWKGGMKYNLVFHDSAMSDLAKNFNKEQSVSFTAISQKKAGHLVLNIKLPQTTHNTILYLKDASGKLINTAISIDSASLRIDYGLLPAGNYTLEAIDDANNNGIWNSGNFATKSLPEKKYKYDKPILIKENWDAEETVVVDYTVKAATIPSFNPKHETETNPDIKQNKKPGKIMKEE